MTFCNDIHIKIKNKTKPIVIRQVDKDSAIKIIDALITINKEIFMANKNSEFMNLITEITID